MTVASKRIVIVGGGLVGSMLAVMLGRAGHTVSVFEKRPDMRRTEISAGRSINLALAERGIQGLMAAELYDDVEPLLIPMSGRMLHPLNEPFEFSPYGQRPHEVIYSVSRGELNKAMLTEAEKTQNVSFTFNQECTAVDLGHRQADFFCHSTGGRTRVAYDVLLGTDGANSVVRDAVVKSVGGTWRTDWLNHDYKELTIPADKNGGYQMERNALHIWPRHGYMLIALPNLGGSFTVTLFLMKTGDPSFERLTDGESLQKFFREQFPDALDLIPELNDDFFTNPTGVLGTVRCSRWTNGQDALLLGDSAHAIVPFHGQGMNAGFEDCRILLELLRDNRFNWPETMLAFEAARTANADAIADMALENYVIMRDTVLDHRFHLKKLLGFELERRLPQRFIPRYSMVMFHNIPYASVKQRGIIQEEIMDELIGTESDLSKINYEMADKLICERLSPVTTAELHDFG
jgi:kynurenine 3-monooxygenase